MMYLRIPLKYLPKRDDAKQGVEWWDRAVANLLDSLTRHNHIDSWATSCGDLAELTPETALEWREEKADV
mgnify:CR=1 FL=1